MYASPIARLVQQLAKLPGIGEKTAARLAFHILRAAPEDAAALRRQGVVGVFTPKDYDMTSMMNEIVDIILRANQPT